jgi:cytochrome P450
MNRYDSADFFTDETLLEDPYPYYEHLRGQSTAWPAGHHGVVAVTGYDEAARIYRDNESFSACNVVAGPFLKLPVPLEGTDITGIIERYRDQIPQNDLIATMDPPMHTRERGQFSAVDADQRRGGGGRAGAPGDELSFVALRLVCRLYR